MTLSFTTKHFVTTDLPVYEYLLCLMYEQKIPTEKEIMETLKISDRQSYRLKSNLIKKGYLRRLSAKKHELTDKMYK